MAEFDNYLPCEKYSAAPDSDKSPGFKSWQEESTGNWYFAVITNRGRVVLRSEAYTTEAARDNGIDSVNRNRDIAERYSLVEEDGKWYIILKAGNHQEIARSCAHDTLAAAQADITMCASDAVETAAIIEDYLPCESYSGHEASDKYEGFSTFTHDGQHYFAMNDGAGNVMLRSEAYTTPSARDNGIESVNRNRDIKERYSIVQDEGGYFIVLKAGNHQEIARSCAFESADAAQAILDRSFAAPKAATITEDYLPCEAYANQAKSEKHAGFSTFSQDDQHYFAVLDDSGNVFMRSEAYKSASARDNGIDSVNRNRDDRERYSIVQDEDDSQLYIILKAGNHQEIARSCPYASEAAAVAALERAFAKPHPTAVVEDYLPCEAYANQAADAKHPGFTTFTADGQHYFAMVDGHGGVILRSEAYKSTSARDNGIDAVLKNRDIEERYDIKQEEDGKWYVCLKAGNHQEIARSCGFDDHASAEGHLLHCYSKKALEDIASGKGQIIEDYLECDAYRHGKPSEFEGFSIFQDEKTKLHYFAMIEEDGKVALKSEGYKDPKRRDNGIESVIRNRGIKDHWRELQDEHGHYMSLRAVNHQEIARSCHYKDAGAMAAWFAPFLAAHAAWSNDAEPEEIAPVIAPIGAAAAAATAAALGAASTITPNKATDPATLTTNTVAPAAVSGGSDWWKWLLGGLLLLGLLWLLMRGCNKTPEATTTSVAPPAVTTPAPAPAATTEAAKPAAAAPVPVAATCNCEAQTDPVFRPNSGTPKSLNRLGTNPEFGNSHGLSPAEFYAKLENRHKTNAVDRAFLDRIYKAMGYKNGFADAKPEQFSAVEVPAGTVGNMGYSKDHKTGYDRLDATGKDLLAFRIKAANGCDLHFMKTCGNHFFFCPK